MLQNSLDAINVKLIYKWVKDKVKYDKNDKDKNRKIKMSNWKALEDFVRAIFSVVRILT
jgi:hypothetical protein